MAKVEDYKAYWMELAAKAGVPEDKAKAMAETLGDEAVAKAFKQAFKAVPDYSYDLDQVRDKTKAEAVAEAKKFYDDWYNAQAKPAYEHNLKIIEEYNRYKSIYGDINNAEGTGNNAGANPGYLTERQAEELINKAMAAQNAAYVGLTKNSMRIATQHLREFGEVLDPDDLDKFAANKGFTNLDQAYKEYVSPRVAERQAKDMETKLKAAREEGAREALSRAKHPGDSHGRGYVNPFTKQGEALPKDAVPEEHSRNAFLDGWENYKEELTKK